MKYVKIVAILWGLAYFAVGATKSFTLNSNDTWASVGLLFTVFLLPLPLAIAAVWLPGIAGNLLLACAAASFSFAAAAIVSRHQPSLADIGTFTFFILLYSIPHVCAPVAGQNDGLIHPTPDRQAGLSASSVQPEPGVSGFRVHPPCRRVATGGVRFRFLLCSLIILLTGSVFDEVAVKSQLPDERIDLTKTQRHLRMAFQIAPDETVLASARFQPDRARFVSGRDAILLRQGENTEDAPNCGFTLCAMHSAAHSTDMVSGPFSACEQLLCGERCSRRLIFFLNAMTAALLPQMLPQEMALARVDQTDVRVVPLDLNAVTDPARWRAVVRRLDLDTAIEMNGSLTVLVIAKRLNG